MCATPCMLETEKPGRKKTLRPTLNGFLRFVIYCFYLESVKKSWVYSWVFLSLKLIYLGGKCAFCLVVCSLCICCSITENINSKIHTPAVLYLKLAL